MHPNPIFRKTDAMRSLALVRDRGFGVLAVSTHGPPLMAHVPVLLTEDASHLLMHLVRSNPICRAATSPVPARLDVLGPDGYISPDWYGVDDQVPTWNYVAVSFTGRLEPLPHSDLPDVLAAQSAAYEGRLKNKAPWTMDKMTDKTRQRFLRMILPFKLHIEDMQSTWKLGQNKPDDVRRRAAHALTDGIGQDLYSLSQLMQHPPQTD